MEQTASSLTPWFAVNELKPYIRAFAKVSNNKVKVAIQKGANRLLSMQTGDGGLAYWPGGQHSEDWATSYGGYALIQAKLNGASVPQQAIDGICKYLSQNVHKFLARENAWEKQSAARSLYTLALAKKVKQSDLNYLFELRERLDPTTRLFLALAIHENDPANPQAKELLESPKHHTQKNHWMRYSTTTQLKLLAYCKISPKSHKIHQIVEKIIHLPKGRNHWGNTWANAATINSMAEYAKILKMSNNSTKFTLFINGEKQIHTLTPAQAVKTIKLNLAEGIDLKASAQGLGFCTTSVFCKPDYVSSTPSSNGGVAISKTYYRIHKDGSRKPMEQAQVGDLIEVELAVTFGERLRYVVIDDPLPGTFECINSEFASQSSHLKGSAKRNWSISHRELRDDRALFFLNSSWTKGTQKISYLARITSSGEVTIPAAKVEAMYDPETYGLTGTGKLYCAPR